jgi:hypothetical protein
MIQILNKETVSLQIHKTVTEHSVTYMDAIIEYCHVNDIPVEDIKKLLNESIISALEIEAETLNLINRTSRKERLDI